MPKQTIRANPGQRHDHYVASDGESFMMVNPDDVEFRLNPVKDGQRFVGPTAEVIRVGWSAEHGVQLDVGLAMAEALGDFVHVGDVRGGGLRPLSQGVHLDRAAINDTIRALRKARDLAFGRDE